MSDWASCTLGDVLTLQRGFDLPVQDRSEGPFPVVASTGIVGTHFRYQVEGPGVVIGRSGSVGGGQFIETPFWPLNTTLWVKGFHGNDPRFCYYLLKSIDFSGFNVGTGVPTLNRNHVHPLPIRRPRIAEQKAISSLLGALDDKIDLNRRMNETLEQTARAIFKDWFVDFGPTRAKMAGQEAYLSEDLWALFPERLDEAGVPEGWSTNKLREMSNVVDYVANGSFASLKANVTLYDEPNYAVYVRTTDYKKGFSSALKYVDRSSFDFLTKSRLNDQDIIISNVGDTGTVFRPPTWLEKPLTLGSNTIALKSGVYNFYLYEYFRSDTGQDAIKSIVAGSAQPKFNKTDFRALVLTKPSQSVLEKFNGIAEECSKRLVANNAEIVALTQTRDLLLPKLMSGELRVRDAEAQVAEVL